MKKLFLLFLIGFIPFIKAQSTFPYMQNWGTYIGGSGTNLLDFFHDGNSFFTDSQNNIYVNGVTTFYNGYSNAYYNQFVTGGGNDISNTSDGSNDYFSKLSLSGMLLKSGYTSAGFSNSTANTYTFDHLIGIDQADNKFMLKYEPGNIPNLATSTAWLLQNTTANNYTITLTKYDSSNTVIWKTYLPNNFDYAFYLRFDENLNVYIIGGTNEEIVGLSTPNVYQESFISYATTSGGSAPNSYIVKLNANGQKIWATYSVAGLDDLDYYNGYFYSINGYNPNMLGVQATSGTFQNTSAKQMLMKWDAATGQKVWATFYGTPYTNNYNGMGNYDIEANETGVYVSGQTDDDNYPTYYASSSAYKSQLTGGGDLYLSKFDFTGNRVWSTYFGSSGYDVITGSPNMSILGDRIIITGTQYGSSDNISTTGSFLTAPSNANNYNMYFAEFDSSGNRKWCSYFGGPGFNTLAEQANPELLNDGSLILWGTTGTNTGIATPNGAYPTMINPFIGQPYGFMSHFIYKESLGTTETNVANDLVLYNNPNNGNFYLSGNVLTKEDCILSIFDTAGRLFRKEQLTQQEKQYFNWQSVFAPGNYIVTVSKKSGEKIKTFKMVVKK